jgi:LmbE family N-acetylglucosaminyl deacetylase
MNILAVGAHPDDVELGCGATIARFVSEGANATIAVMTDGSRGPSGYDSRRDESLSAVEQLGAQLAWGGWSDGELTSGPESITWLETLIAHVKPDMVFTHSLRDSHQDHVACATIALAAARNLPQILHFETPSTLTFNPTVFCDVAGFVDSKLSSLRCHLSQVVSAKRVDLEAVEAQLRFRGFQSRLRFAEGFEPSRCLLGDSIRHEKHIIDLTETTSNIQQGAA